MAIGKYYRASNNRAFFTFPEQGIEIKVNKVPDNSLSGFIFGIQDNERELSKKFEAVLDKGVVAAQGSLWKNVSSYTGDLRNSIEIKGGNRAGGAGGGRLKYKKVTIGRNIPYFKYVIEGTGLHGPKNREIIYNEVYGKQRGLSYKPQSGIESLGHKFGTGSRSTKDYMELGKFKKSHLFSNHPPFSNYGKANTFRDSGFVIFYKSTGQRGQNDLLKGGFIENSRRAARKAVEKGLSEF